MKELISIINELHAPKNKTNNFGKFNYRDAAGILEAVKPLLIKHNCLLIPAKSEIKQIGDRYYLYCTVGIRNSEGKEEYATAPAREQESKSGMDAAQLTGACISYAKKYALCSLFGIDDSSDDPDTDDSTKKQHDTTTTTTPTTQVNPLPTVPTVPQTSNPTKKQKETQENEENGGYNWAVAHANVAAIPTRAAAVKWLTDNKYPMPISKHTEKDPSDQKLVTEICEMLKKKK